MNVFQRIVSQRRIGRGDWWIGTLLPDIPIGIVAYFTFILDLRALPIVYRTLLILYLILGLLYYICSIYVSVKRCHDLGHNGWWQLIPFYGIWIAFVAGDEEENEYGPNPNAKNFHE